MRHVFDVVKLNLVLFEAEKHSANMPRRRQASSFTAVAAQCQGRGVGVGGSSVWERTHHVTRRKRCQPRV